MRQWPLIVLLVILWFRPAVPLNADEHPTGNQIAFILVEDNTSYLATINPDGTDLRRVAVCMNLCRDPVWSADGNRLGFVDGNALVTVEINTGETDRFPVDLGTYDYNVHPAWSGDLRFVIHAARVNMSGVLRFTDLLRHNTSELEDIPDAPFFPIWIDDDKGFLFAARGIIYHYDVKQKHLTSLTKPGQQFDQPLPSPDGSRILLRRINQDDTGLSLLDHETRQIESVMAGIVDTPRWSPDGQFIAVSLWDEDDLSLKLLDLETGDLTTLATNIVSGSVLDWSPDGERIAYIGTSDEQPQFNSLFILDRTADTDPHPIVDRISRAGSPATGIDWQPEGANP